MDTTTLAILGVAFLATFIRSAFGFGEALIAVPLLALLMPLRVAAPVAVLLSITVALVVVAQDWRRIHIRSVGWLLASTLVGMPFGVLLLRFGHEALIKTALALVILAYAGYSLVAPRLGRTLPVLPDESRPWLLGCGFTAGLLGGACGMNGPPLVLYGTMRRWTPQQFRATLQGYFLPASAGTLVGYLLAGLWVPAVTHDYLWALASALPAIFLGRELNRRLHGEAFLSLVYLGLLGIGLTLLAQVVRGA